MNGMPIPGERMEEFKYLAFLSFAAKHFKKLSKKKKVLMFLFLGFIAVIVALIVFLKLVAFNPVIAVTSVKDNSAYNEAVRKDSAIRKQFVKEGLVSSF